MDERPASSSDKLQDLRQVAVVASYVALLVRTLERSEPAFGENFDRALRDFYYLVRDADPPDPSSRDPYLPDAITQGLSLLQDMLKDLRG